MGNKINNVITIDGFLASGRTTLANGLVNTYGFKHLNLETVLRRLADRARRKQIKLDDTDRVLKLASVMKDEDLLDPKCNAELRKPEIMQAALQLFKMPELPEVLNPKFNQLAQTQPGLVAVGTSMGRVVFPDAPVQLFLVAARKNHVGDMDERAARLCRMHKLPTGAPVALHAIEDSDTAMRLKTSMDGWRLAPNGNGWKEAPVSEMKDLELASGLQQVYVNTMSLGTGKVKEIAVTLIKQRLPHVQTISEAKLTSQVSLTA